MALDATVGGANSDSYVDQSYTDDYFTGHMKETEWSNATNQEEALRYAAFYLDVMVTWLGDKATSTQALEWPRSGLSDYENDEIPTFLKKAQCELALFFIEKGIPTKPLNLDRFKAGTFELEMTPVSGQIPDIVTGLISDYGSIRQLHGSISTPKLERV